jgi:alanyl aminopeptidase
MQTSRILGVTGRLITLILLVGCVAGAAFAQQTPEFRLPDAARPTRYRIDLTILPDQPTFRGRAIISVDLKERTDTIWLNAKDLTISGMRVRFYGTPMGGDNHPRWRTTDEFLAVILATPIGPGPAEIEIFYTGNLDAKGNAGVYRKMSGGDWYVFTSFTPIDARRAFPCFDEPGYKAPWELVLHVKQSETAVANASEVSSQNQPDGMKRVTFALTQPLASEVVAFAVGPFDVVDAGVAGQNKVPVRIITPRGRGVEAGPASLATPQILERLEQYTGIPYPWDKLDHLALLDLPFGATENPGLITYRSDLLLARPERDTQRRQQTMRSVMTHELAHQWFGNLVTQAWWNDVWLSEGFATWLEAKISDLERPAFERGMNITEIRDDTMNGDSVESRAVRVPIRSRKDADDVYDRVEYVKAASILQMIEDWIGAEAMQRSLRRYLAEHKFGNATTEDLADAIRREAGVDVSAVLGDFLDRPGAPAVRFSMTDSGAAGKKLVMEESGKPWTIPVCVHVEAMARRCEVISGARAEIAVKDSPGWIWTNAYGSGYYRSLMAVDLMAGVMEKGYLQMEDTERLAFAGDVEGLTTSGELPAGESMKTLPRLARDSEPRVKVKANAIGLKLAAVMPEADRAAFAEWLSKNLGMTMPPAGQGASVETFLRDKP